MDRNTHPNQGFPGAGGFRRELAARRRPRRWKLVLILCLVAAVAVSLAIAIYVVSTSPGGEEAYSGTGWDSSVVGFDVVNGEGDGIFIHVKPTFIVNLAGVGGRYAMRVQIRLLVDSRKVAD